MKVHFEFSAADLAEVGSRAMNRSPLVRRWRLRHSIAGAILMGLLVFAAAPGDLAIRGAAGLVVAAVMFVILVNLRRGGNMRLREFYRERLGGDGPFACEVELTATGIVSRQLGQEAHHPWSQVASVAEVPGGIEFVYQPIGSLLVRDRAFSDPQVKLDFLSLAQGFVPANAQLEAPFKAKPEATLPTHLTESDYLVAWLLFFLCSTVSTTVVNAVIGASGAAIFRMPGVAAMYGAFVIGGISFVIGACFSYVFFRLFAKRLVYRAQAQIHLNAA